jgi:hypothetical protein
MANRLSTFPVSLTARRHFLTTATPLLSEFPRAAIALSFCETLLGSGYTLVLHTLVIFGYTQLVRILSQFGYTPAIRTLQTVSYAPYYRPF